MTTTEQLHQPNRVAKELLDRNAFLMARLGTEVKARAMQMAEDAGFELYDYGLLAILGEGARETQATIAHALDLDPSRLVAVLDRLESKGLIERQRDPLDRRRHAVSITAAGKRELAKLRDYFRALEDNFFSVLDADERRALHELLSKVACAVDPRCSVAETKTA